MSFRALLRFTLLLLTSPEPIPLGQLLSMVLAKRLPNSLTESPLTSYVILKQTISKYQEVREDGPELPSLLPPLADHGNFGKTTTTLFVDVI